MQFLEQQKDQTKSKPRTFNRIAQTSQNLIAIQNYRFNRKQLEFETLPPPFSESEALLRQHIQWSQQNWIVGPAKPSIKALAVRFGVDRGRREGLQRRLSGESIVCGGAVEYWGIGGGVLERLGVDDGFESLGGESGVVAQVTVVVERAS